MEVRITRFVFFFPFKKSQDTCVNTRPGIPILFWLGKGSQYEYYENKRFNVGIRHYVNVGGTERVKVSRGLKKKTYGEVLETGHLYLRGIRASSLLLPSMFHTRFIHWKWKWSHSVTSDSLRPMDCSLPHSSVHGIFQARVLEWSAISFSRGPSRPKALLPCTRCFTVWATSKFFHWQTVILNYIGRSSGKWSSQTWKGMVLEMVWTL